MLLFFTPGNCATFKYKVYNVLSILDGNMIWFNVFPMFWVDVNRKKYPPCLWWEKPRWYIYWDLVETNLWHTTLEMKDMKFLLHYKMNFEILNNLVLELTPFSHLSSLNLVRPQLNIRKIVVIVIYRFAHGYNATHMVNRFNVGASII